MLRPAGLGRRGFLYPYTVHNMPLMSELKTPKEALTLALYLALTAPSEDKVQELGAMADSLAQGLSTEEVEACKAIALAQFHHDCAE